MGKRKSREEVDKGNFDLLKPIDISSLGSAEDPCFGISHDLMASECKACGDSEFCAIVKAQGLHKERLAIENKQRFKDIEEADHDMIKLKEEAKDLIKSYQEAGLKRLKIILRVCREMSLPKDTVKQIYNQI